jgi:hypothetical protein
MIIVTAKVKFSALNKDNMLFPTFPTFRARLFSSFETSNFNYKEF